MVDLFGRLTAILGAVAMNAVYEGVDPAAVKREWAEALAGFTADEVKRGLAAVRLRKFAPNLPDFLHLCRPSLDPDVAWLEAGRGMQARKAHEAFAWSHPAVYWAARTIDFDEQPAAFDKVRKRWTAVLEAEFAKGAWASPPDFARLAISAPTKPEENRTPPSPARKAEIAAMLRACRERLTGVAP